MTYLCVDGLIGSGKTTLANKLSALLGWRVLAEPVEDNFMLEPFYKDQRRWAFEMQLFLLHARYRLQQIAAHEPRPVILDRCLPSDRCFMRMHVRRGNIAPLQERVYEECFNSMVAIRPPFMMLYLDVAPKTALERVQKRARGAESGLDLQYLMDLRDEYEVLLDQIQNAEPRKHAWARGIRIVRTVWSDGSDEDSSELNRLVQMVRAEVGR